MSEAFLTIYASSTASCPRKIMFDKLHLPVELSPYIQRRIFDGNLHEASILEEAYEVLNLRKIKFDELPENVQKMVEEQGLREGDHVNFGQFRMQIPIPDDPDIQFVGKIDDLAVRIEDGAIVLLEAKAVGTNTWVKMLTKGIQDATPYYYEQVQLYLWMLRSLGIDVKQAYLTVRNVDTKNKPYDFRWFAIHPDEDTVRVIFNRFKALKPQFAQVMASKMLSTDNAIEAIKNVEVPYQSADLPPCELCIYRDYCYPPKKEGEELDMDEIHELMDKILELKEQLDEYNATSNEYKALTKKLAALLPDDAEIEYKGHKFKKIAYSKPTYKWGDILKSLDHSFLQKFAKESRTEYVKIK